MKKSATSIALLVLLTAMVVATSGCGETKAVQASFTVDGMTCESCSEAITETLSKMEGVERASADHVEGTAEAVFLSPGVTPEGLAAEIEGLGYTVTATEIVPTES